MSRNRLVRIVSAPPSAAGFGPDWVVVGVDVFRATTVLCTASEMGRRCFVGSDVDEAFALAEAVPGALLGGEQAGRVPAGFDLGNSPAEISNRDDVDRPLVLVTSSGTPLLRSAVSAGRTYAACLRNVTAQVEHLITLDSDVVAIGAGTRGQRRAEDDLVCARIVAALLTAGYRCDEATREVVEQYRSVQPEICAWGPSAAFLRRVGRQDDIDFVLSHVDDTDTVVEVRNTEAFDITCGIRHAY